MNPKPHLFTIGEFSQITGLSVKTLRFYDEKGLLKPAQVDALTGYRHYDASSVERARMISRLRELDFPLDDVASVLAECTDDREVLPHFQRQLRRIQERLRADQRMAKALQTAIEDETSAAALCAGGKFQPEEKTLGELIIAGHAMKGRYQDCGRGFKIIGRAMGRHLAGKPMCLFYDGEYREDDASFEPCFPLRREVPAAEGIVVRRLPAVRCLTLVHQGPYQQLGRSYAVLLAELRRRGHSAALPSREMYVKGPGMIFKGNPKNYLTEIQIPIADA